MLGWQDCYRIVTALGIAIKDVTVTASISDFVKKLSEDPVKLKQFLRNVMGPTCRTIVGTEKALMLTLFKLIDPVSSSNNQRSFTDVYIHADKEYHVHYFDNDIEVEEILKDDI